MESWWWDWPTTPDPNGGRMELTGTQRLDRDLPDHVLTHILVTDDDGEPMGEVTATGIIAGTHRGDGAAIVESADRAVRTARRLGFTGSIAITDLYGSVGRYGSV